MNLQTHSHRVAGRQCPHWTGFRHSHQTAWLPTVPTTAGTLHCYYGLGPDNANNGWDPTLPPMGWDPTSPPVGWDPISHQWAGTRPHHQWAGTRPHHQWAGTRPCHQWAGTRPCHQWTGTRPCHQWAGTRTHVHVNQPASNQLNDQPSCCQFTPHGALLSTGHKLHRDYIQTPHNLNHCHLSTHTHPATEAEFILCFQRQCEEFATSMLGLQDCIHTYMGHKTAHQANS